MQLKKSLFLGITALSFGVLAPLANTNAHAYTTYRTIPKAIRGYYINHGNIAMLTGHRIVLGKPQADAYTQTVTSVAHQGHYYHIHAYVMLPNRINITHKIAHLSRYKIRIGSSILHKVSKSHYYWYANHGVTG